MATINIFSSPCHVRGSVVFIYPLNYSSEFCKMNQTFQRTYEREYIHTSVFHYCIRSLSYRVTYEIQKEIKNNYTALHVREKKQLITGESAELPCHQQIWINNETYCVSPFGQFQKHEQTLSVFSDRLCIDKIINNFLISHIFKCISQCGFRLFTLFYIMLILYISVSIQT